jgi:hypothetical protein
MVDGVFLVREGKMSILRVEPYENEGLLQQALALYPEVLAGSTTTGGHTRLLLVQQEMGIPSNESGGDTFSLDHLFLDSSGIPVIVEVKRASDTRIRREVVGQMLDYAANALRYWPVGRLRGTVEAGDPEVWSSFLGDRDAEEFWAAVESNLATGRVRLVFVADRVPAVLETVIEFLNDQMSRAEVLGVEVPQYVGDSMQLFVPRLIGKTTSAAAAKSPSGTLWTRDSFLEAAAERLPDAQLAFVSDLLQHVEEHGHRLVWGKGATPGFSAWYAINDIPVGLWYLNVNNPGARAYLQIYLDGLAARGLTANAAAGAAVWKGLPAFAPKLADAEAASWVKEPSLYLDQIVDVVGGADCFLSGLGAVLEAAPGAAH